jgi:23S rRNA-/tRNA-specific pseudouridylate synthase
VVNALAYYLANDSPYGTGDFVDDNVKMDVNEAISLRPGIVHRLDKGTTGILVVSKTGEALANLSAAFAARKVKKTYLAITVGNPGKHVVIDKPIGRHPIHRQRMRVVPDPHRKNSSGVTPKERIRIKKMQMTSPSASSTAQTGRRALSYVDTLKVSLLAELFIYLFVYFFKSYYRYRFTHAILL